MSIQSEITRIQNNVANSLTAVAAYGVEVPDGTNSDALPALIAQIGASKVPDYITTESERVAKAVQATRTAKSLVFPVMSDFHLYDGNSAHDASLLSAWYAGMGIAELKKRMHLDFVGYLGDFTCGTDNHTAAQAMADITAVKESTDTNETEVWCVGNHDLNYGAGRDRLLTPDEVFSHIGANADGVKPYENIERGYGYLDFDNQKIRVIYLNTCDASDWTATNGTAAKSEWVSPTQMQWLVDTALNFEDKVKPSEWGIVVMGHHPLHYAISSIGCVMTILEAYRGGTAGSVSTAINGTEYTVPYDFTGLSEKAEIICNIHGHNHNCGYSQISSTTKTGSTSVAPWLWRICVPNICANRYNSGYTNFESDEVKRQNYGEFDDNGNPVYWYKEAGTAKATSFCVMNIDRKNKKVYAHIFGAGKDRVVGYDSAYVPVEYGVSVTVKNCSAASNNPTSITENGTATLTFTANGGYVLPDSVAVNNASYTWDKAHGVLTLSIPTGEVAVAVTAVESTPDPSYTNQIPISTDANGAVYNGTGYKLNTKISSSGGTDTTASGFGTTGYMPIPQVTSHDEGQVVLYLKNMEAVPAHNDVRVAIYDSSKTYLRIVTAYQSTEGYTQYKGNYWVGDDGYISRFDLSTFIMNQAQGAAYVRFCAQGLDGDSIITINEKIV